MIETLVEIRHIEDFGEQGFYSKTYRAEDLRLNRVVAVKDIVASAIESKEAVEKYFEEAQRLSIASHPRVLPVYFVGIDNNGAAADVGAPRIVTKYMKNGSLNQFLNAVYSGGSSLELGTAIRFAHDIIQGMIHLHSLDILHLDLKASNIFIGDDGKLILADFGQSKMLNEDSIVQVESLYPSILTPESIRRRVADKTTDIYQFGVLLYSIFNYDIYRKALDEEYNVNTEVLLRVFRAENNNDEEKEQFRENMRTLSSDIKNGNFPNRDSHHYYVPKAIQNVINKCLEVNVADRYQNFYEIQTDINKLTMTKDAQDLKQSFENSEIIFNKNNQACLITVEENSGRYNLRAKKNNRAVNAFSKDNLTRLQLAREIEMTVNGI